MKGRQVLSAEWTGSRREPESSSQFRIQIRRAGTRGQGVFTADPISRGEVAIVGRPVAELAERTWQTLQVGVASHIKIDEPFELVNHSCDPNCGIRPNDHGGYDLIAMRDIAAGEEITFDYCMTEWICVGFSACRCGSDRCRKTILGAQGMAAEDLSLYEGFTAPHLENLAGS